MTTLRFLWAWFESRFEPDRAVPFDAARAERRRLWQSLDEFERDAEDGMYWR